MRLIKGNLAKKAKTIRRKRDKACFTAGIILGGAAAAFVSKLLGKWKCKNCVKRLLAEKK